MRVLIMGGGIIGISTAWYLAELGCAVTVIERQHDVALETSFANCGEISPGCANPWAAPGIPFKALKWLLKKHSPLAIKLDFSWHQLSWMLKMWANCNSEGYNVNTRRMMRLAKYSRDKLQELRMQTQIDYEGLQKGTLQLFRHQKELEQLLKDVAMLNECGIAFNLLDQDGCVQIEPGLKNAKHLLAGGLQIPGDETGDCHIFTQQLAKRCLAKGVRFVFDTSITAIEKAANKVTGIKCDNETFTADHYVIALGSFSYELMQSIGVNIPVYPVKGYSITVPIINPDMSPVSTILDMEYKVAITRFNERIRVGGLAELCGYNIDVRKQRIATLEKVLNELYSGSGDLSLSDSWAGLRPMTPDGAPIIGGTPLNNLSINTGHGTMGWTMGLGSGKVLADQIMGIDPEIMVDDLSLARFH